MNQFKITFQNPFAQDVTHINYIDQKETVKSFLAIDWEKLNLDVFEREDEVLNDFYFFSIDCLDSKNGKSCLTITGQYAYGDTLTNSGIQFDAIYERTIAKTSRSFFGLGTEKTKMVETITHKDQRNKEFVVKCLEEFLSRQIQFLEQELNEQMPSNFRRD